MRQEVHAAGAAERLEMVKAEFRATWELRVADYNARLEARESARQELARDRAEARAARAEERAIAREEREAAGDRRRREASSAMQALEERRAEQYEKAYQARHEYWDRIRAEREAAKQARWLARPVIWPRELKPRGGYVKFQRAPAVEPERPPC